MVGRKSITTTEKFPGTTQEIIVHMYITVHVSCCAVVDTDFGVSIYSCNILMQYGNCWDVFEGIFTEGFGTNFIIINKH